MRLPLQAGKAKRTDTAGLVPGAAPTGDSGRPGWARLLPSSTLTPGLLRSAPTLGPWLPAQMERPAPGAAEHTR